MLRFNKRTLATLAGVVMLAAVSLVLLTTPKPATSKAQAPAALPTVTVEPAIDRTVSDWQEYAGRLEAVERVEIRPRVAGVLLAVHFSDGEQIEQGELLFTIDPAPFEARLQQALANQAQAQDRQRFTEIERLRGQRLLTVHAISRRDADTLENAAHEAASALKAAQARVASARLDVGYTRITAPIAGRISRAEITAGNLLTAGGEAAALASIVSIEPIYAAFNVDEQTYLRFFASTTKAPGAAPVVRLGLAGDDGYPREGTLHSVDNQLDTASGTIRARARFANLDGQMVPGLQARVQVQGSAPYRAVLVDTMAIDTDQDRRFVLVVNADDKVEYRALTLGSRQGRWRVVRAGLSASDRVIVDGGQRVKPGDTVQVRLPNPPAAQPAAAAN